MLRKFAKAAVHAGTEVQLSREVAETTAVVASLVLEVAAADQLEFFPDWLLLYGSLSQGVQTSPGLLWQDAEFAVAHAKRSLDCWSEPCLSLMPEVTVEQLHKADAGA